MSDSKRSVLVEVTISAPIETVWKAVRDPEQISQWFGWDSDTLDDEIAMIFGNPDAADDERHILQFGEWEGVADAFEMVEVDGKTVLRVVRSGAPPTDWDEVYSDVREGWVTFVHQLRLWIERHHGKARRTVYFSGPMSGSLIEALGLTERDGSLELPSGATQAEPWHRSGFQQGLHVPAWGDGMLVAMDMPADAERPQRGSLVLTTFGMDDAEAEAFSEQWTQWWDSRQSA